MCNFFSFVTEPEKHGGKRFYFDWKQRQRMSDGQDSHSTICAHYNLNEDVCNKYEYNPLTKAFVVDQINSGVDDRIQAHEWVEKLNWKKVVEPLIIKPIVHPFRDIPKVEHVTEQHIQLLREWTSVWTSARDSIRDSIRASVWVFVKTSVWNSVNTSVWASAKTSVWDSVMASFWDSIWDSIYDSVGDSVLAYISSFFDVKYDRDFSSCIKLWDSGLVPSFDGTTWRLHSGENADVVYEMKAEE